MVGWNVFVIQAVDEEHRSLHSGDRLFRRSRFHIQSVFQANIEEADIHRRTEERSTDPGSGVKRLAHTRIGNFAKTRERRLGNHRTKPSLARKSLQQLRCSHRFAQSVHAPWRIIGLDPINPAVNVVSFSDAVSRQSSAVAMASRVGHQNAVMIFDQPLAVPIHAQPIVRNAMQQNYSVAVRLLRPHEPCMQNSSIRSRETYILEFGAISLGPGLGMLCFSLSDRMTVGMDW